ncbi:MAG: DUF2505 domain-containing protein [Mycobacterium sp.]
MSRSFDGLTESPATVDQIHAAFGREDYWLARLGSGEADTTLDSLTVAADGTVGVRVTQRLGRLMLPGLVSKFVSGDVQLVHAETWTPDGDGQVRGQITASVSGGLGSCRATTRLEPTAHGSKLSFAGRVDVKIPLVGGNLEKSFGANLAESIPTVVRFTTTWIDEHG